ncbi:MAG: ABC transporter permease [Brachymonas sp.]|nr:ABC transporter permease [Brachymonas sp.]
MSDPVLPSPLPSHQSSPTPASTQPRHGAAMQLPGAQPLPAGPAAWRPAALRPGVVLAGLFLLLLACMALLPGVFATADPNHMDLSQRLAPLSRNHWFGTDNHGRDIFSRVVFGTRTSLITAVAVVCIGAGLGTFIGLLAGFLGGMVDQCIMRVVDLLLALPGTIFAIALVGVLGPSSMSVVIALSLSWWVSYARMIRGLALQVKEQTYIQGARLMGGGPLYIMRKHVLPNVITPVFALATLDIGSAILHITSLSFLGLAAQPPTAEWGAMIQSSISFMEQAPQTMLFPGLAIALSVVAFNTVGSWLKEVSDPIRLQGMVQ